MTTAAVTLSRPTFATDNCTVYTGATLGGIIGCSDINSIEITSSVPTLSAGVYGQLYEDQLQTIGITTNSLIGQQSTSGTVAYLRDSVGQVLSATNGFVTSGVEITCVSDGTYNITISGVGTSIGFSKKDMLRDHVRNVMRNNLMVKMGRSRSAVRTTNPNELKAQRTLRDHLTERAFRRYMTNGFIMVQGRSGLYYQIFNDRRHTMVYDKNNRKVGEICINTDSVCPPTDHVINIKTMVELDEISVWKGGNLKQFSEDFQIPFQLSKDVHSYIGQPIANPYVSSPFEPEKGLSLVEAYRKAKQGMVA